MASIGGYLGFLLGGVDGLVKTLALFMAADYCTGVLSAFKEKRLSSRAGFWGLARKACILLIVGIGNFIDYYVIGSGAAIRTAVIFFYLSNEGLSILENLDTLGVPFPDKIKGAMLKMRKKAGDGDE